MEAGEPGAEVAALLRGLRGGALYRLRVRAVSRRGAGPPGAPVTARAPSAAAPPGERSFGGGGVFAATDANARFSGAEGVVVRAHGRGARGRASAPALRRGGRAAAAAPLGAAAGEVPPGRARRLAAAG